MATITGLTAARMLEIEASSVVDGDVVGDNLILTTKGGSQIDAGSVRGPKGDVGPVGQDLSALSAVPVLEVGMPNQIRAGRQLALADFTSMGLAAPIGLWNLSDLTDASGNAHTLINKGAIPFASGINGLANTAAQFSGSGNVQALYVSDTGAADPFRIRTGSFGAWARSAKRSLQQNIFGKWSGPNNQRAYLTYVDSTNVAVVLISYDGNNYATLMGVSDIVDDRWHFIVSTFDGATIRLYVDGVCESSMSFMWTIFPASSAINIGSQNADAATAGASPHFGRIDEVFVTTDILSDEQVRNLYCAKIPHTLPKTPIRVSLNVRRRRKGAALVAADFPVQPLRLHNFSGGSLGDDGSNNTNLAVNAGAPAVVSGVDGTYNNAYWVSGGGQLASTDTGLPSDLAIFPKRSCGFWMRSTQQSAATILGWGAGAIGVSDLRVGINFGMIFSTSAGDTLANVAVVCDGLWHLIVEVDDNTVADGIKRKLYVDGRCLGGSTVMNPIILGGANRFSIGCAPPGIATQPFSGQLDSVFVCAQALTLEQIAALYAKSSQALGASPKEAGAHVEALRSADVLAIFDTLESQHQIDLAVA